MVISRALFSAHLVFALVGSGLAQLTSTSITVSITTTTVATNPYGIPTLVYNCAKMPAMCKNVAQVNPLGPNRLLVNSLVLLTYDTDPVAHNRRRDEACGGNWYNTHPCPEPGQPPVVLKNGYIDSFDVPVRPAFIGSMFNDPNLPIAQYFGAAKNKIADQTGTYQGVFWSCDEWPPASVMEGGANAQTYCTPMAQSCSTPLRDRYQGISRASEQNRQGRAHSRLQAKGLNALTPNVKFRIHFLTEYNALPLAPATKVIWYDSAHQQANNLGVTNTYYKKDGGIIERLEDQIWEETYMVYTNGSEHSERRVFKRGLSATTLEINPPQTVPSPGAASTTSHLNSPLTNQWSWSDPPPSPTSVSASAYSAGVVSTTLISQPAAPTTFVSVKTPGISPVSPSAAGTIPVPPPLPGSPSPASSPTASPSFQAVVMESGTTFTIRPLVATSGASIVDGFPGAVFLEPIVSSGQPAWVEPIITDGTTGWTAPTQINGAWPSFVVAVNGDAGNVEYLNLPSGDPPPYIETSTDGGVSGSAAPSNAQTTSNGAIPPDNVNSSGNRAGPTTGGITTGGGANPTSSDSPTSSGGGPTDGNNSTDNRGGPTNGANPTDGRGGSTDGDNPTDGGGDPTNGGSPTDGGGGPTNGVNPTDGRGGPTNGGNPTDSGNPSTATQTSSSPTSTSSDSTIIVTITSFVTATESAGPTDAGAAVPSDAPVCDLDADGNCWDDSMCEYFEVDDTTNGLLSWALTPDTGFDPAAATAAAPSSASAPSGSTAREPPSPLGATLDPPSNPTTSSEPAAPTASQVPSSDFAPMNNVECYGSGDTSKAGATQPELQIAVAFFCDAVNGINFAQSGPGTVVGFPWTVSGIPGPGCTRSVNFFMELGRATCGDYINSTFCTQALAPLAVPTDLGAGDCPAVVWGVGSYLRGGIVDNGCLIVRMWVAVNYTDPNGAPHPPPCVN